MTENTENKSASRGLPKRLEGVVVSTKMNKTIVVSISRQVKHRTYKKFVRETKRYHAHDERMEAKEGDTVQIVETRPMSKLKRWRMQKIITRAV
ncbi:MAG: 30S ribosomal protein S17 [Bdellovibrionales bacterium]|nr:30S ribosomal protein S17 [Bdellovibrionales bacterium]